MQLTLRQLQSWINDGAVAKPARCGDLTAASVLCYEPRQRFAAGRLEDGRLIVLWPRHCLIVERPEEIWNQLNRLERASLEKSLTASRSQGRELLQASTQAAT